MEDKNLHLKVVTPRKVFFDDEVEGLVFKAKDGYMQILKNHIPIMTTAGYGIMRIYYLDGEVELASLMGGTVFVENNIITILTEDASWPSEIDIQRAESARQRAEERLSSKEDGIDIERASIALTRALVRIDLANTGEKMSKKSGNK